MAFTGTIKVMENTGPGRALENEVSVTVVDGVVVSAGGGTAMQVINKSGADLARDQLVYVSGSDGGVLEVSQADANVDDKPAMFFLPAAILNNGLGLAYARGLSVATLNTNAGTVDDPVYLSETAGGWTLTAPSAAGSIDQIVGRIAVKSATVGQINWNIEAGDYDIGTNELQDKAVTLVKQADLARGSIYTGQASNRPAALDLKADGAIAIGDATDVNAAALTGSVSMTNAGLTALVKGLEDDGHGAIGYVYCTGAVADTELVTINGRTYEFDNDSTFTGDVQVDVTGDLTADAAMTALAAAINGDATRSVDAVVMAGNSDTTAGVLLIAKAIGSTNFTLTTDITNGGVVSAATMTQAAAATNRKMTFLEYTITAADVTLLALTGGNSVVIGGVVSTTEPILTSFLVLTSAGAIVPTVATMAITFLQANTNFWLVILDSSVASFTTNDTIGMALAV